MNLVLLGAPGAGKGTLGAKLKEAYNIPHISTGEILRQAIKDQTEIGNIAKQYIDKGEFVPDDVIIEIVKERINEEDAKNGYILDGFPRTLTQAQKLQEFTKLTAVINIDIPTDKLMKRLTGRRVCSNCGETYHISLLNGKTECEKCGGKLIQRNDDKEETILKRIKVYFEQTEPLIAFYKQNNLLKDFDGNRDAKEILESVIKALD